MVYIIIAILKIADPMWLLATNYFLYVLNTLFLIVSMKSLRPFTD